MTEMNETQTVEIPLSDFDLQLIPPAARQPGTEAFRNAVSAFIDYSYPPKVVKRFTDLQQKLRHLPDSKDLLQDIPAAGAFISGNPRDGHIAFTFFELNAVDKR